VIVVSANVVFVGQIGHSVVLGSGQPVVVAVVHSAHVGHVAVVSAVVGAHVIVVSAKVVFVGQTGHVVVLGSGQLVAAVVVHSAHVGHVTVVSAVADVQTGQVAVALRQVTLATSGHSVGVNVVHSAHVGHSSVVAVVPVVPHGVAVDCVVHSAQLGQVGHVVASTVVVLALVAHVLVGHVGHVVVVASSVGPVLQLHVPVDAAEQLGHSAAVGHVVVSQAVHVPTVGQPPVVVSIVVLHVGHSQAVGVAVVPHSAQVVTGQVTEVLVCVVHSTHVAFGQGLHVHVPQGAGVVVAGAGGGLKGPTT
jgi:hypothetical protein